MSIQKKDPVQIIAFTLLALKKASEIIGSIEWRGRFRKRTDEGIEALTKVNEMQQEAIENLTDLSKFQQGEIAELKEKMQVLYKN